MVMLINMQAIYQLWSGVVPSPFRIFIRWIRYFSEINPAIGLASNNPEIIVATNSNGAIYP